MKTQVLTDTGLSIYDQEIKKYIKSQGTGVTLDEVQELIEASEENTTYTLTKNENNEIVLTGSDGSATSVTDSDTNTTYGVATSSALGLVKSGTDITVDSNGNVSVNDDSHNHVISNVDGLQTALDSKASSSHTHTKSQITDFPSSLKNPSSININGISYDGSSAKDIDLLPFVVGTQTTATGSWTGIASSISSLFDGLTIRYWLPYAGSGNATLNLTLADGSTTGAINCYYGGATRLTTHYPAGNIITLTYRSNISIAGSSTTYTGWWADANYDSGNTRNSAGSTDTSSKIYLVGTTSQTSYATSYSHDTAYVGTDGCLYSNNTKVSVEGHSHSAYVNQNAFSNVVVGSTTVAADSATDTLTLVAGSNVTITPDATNDKITISSTDTNTTYSAGTGISLSGTTFSNSGVRSIATGTSNGTISVNTNGTTANVAVKGLGSAAYTDSSAYAAASHTHSYLPLSGGTVDGELNVGSSLKLWSDSEGGNMRIYHPNDTSSYYEWDTANGRLRLFHSSTGDAWVFFNDGTMACPGAITAPAFNYSSGEKIIHSGNYTEYCSPNYSYTGTYNSGYLSSGSITYSRRGYTMTITFNDCYFSCEGGTYVCIVSGISPAFGQTQRCVLYDDGDIADAYIDTSGNLYLRQRNGGKCIRGSLTYQCI